jgi:hypothetical protein
VSDLERRQQRLDRAWIAIRFELFVALAAPGGLAFLYVAAPRGGEPMFPEPLPVGQALLWVGALGYVLGLVWMIRLSRPRPEAGEPSWRYRS